MKNILIGLLTFLIGNFAFNLLNFEKSLTFQTLAPVKKVVETPETRIEDFPNQKRFDNSKPFFSSFKENEGYGGWLIADNFKGMKEVWTILLKRDNENSEESEPLVWTAHILTQHADYSANDDDDFHSLWIKTENNRLSFRTNKIRGIEYRFNGEFFKSGKDFSDAEKVLKGTLEKSVKDKTVGKFTADFAYNEPHCFH